MTSFDDLNDTALIYLVKAGPDDRAFTELVKRHQSRLRAFLFRLSGGSNDVDDMAQTSFMKALRGVDTFEGGCSFRSWLFAIAYREFLQVKRKDGAKDKLQHVLEDQLEPTSLAPMSQDLSIDLQKALAQLPDLERASLILCDAAGFTHAEAASVLNAPLGSVKTYIARARETMRSLLTESTKNGVHETPGPQDTNRTRKGAIHAAR